MPEPVTVIFIGIATLDRISFVDTVPVAGAKIRARDHIEIGGGQGANAAVTAARLGGRAVLCSLIGGDQAGRAILDGLASEGVQADGVLQIPAARSITAAILVDSHGERTIVADFDPRLLDAGPLLDTAVLGPAKAVMADVKLPEIQEPLLATARSRGIPVILDIEPAPPGYQERLASFADHALFSRTGLAAFTGASNAHEGLHIANSRLGCVVGVTLGAGGSRFIHGDDEFAIPAPAIEAVDTTAAGDAFHGAYALAIAEGRGVPEAARFATAVAALKCTRPGGRAGLPTRAEAERFMETLT